MINDCFGLHLLVRLLVRNFSTFATYAVLLITISIASSIIHAGDGGRVRGKMKTHPAKWHAYINARWDHFITPLYLLDTSSNF